MRKIILGILALTTITGANAQKGLGIQAGINLATISGEDADGAKIKTGFQGGVSYDIDAAKNFVIQPGLNFIQNGAKTDDGGDEVKLTLPYLQLPVLFLYTPEVGDGSKILLGAGPYAGYGIGKVKGSFGGISASVPWKDADIEQFDAGAKLLIGYQSAIGLTVNLNGGLGLTKLEKDSKVHNTAFGITLGYTFK